MQAQKLTGIKRILPAFLYSIEGLKSAASEPAIRLELQMMFLNLCAIIFCGAYKAMTFSAFWQTNAFYKILIWFAVVLLLWLFVLLVEIINTSIESVVDYISTERHPLAKKAKDLGSAAVFLALGICFLGNLVMIWVLCLW